MNPAVQKLESVFGEIARTRMAGLPIVNPVLDVATVGFREWQGRWAGVLLTPWCINLVMLPGDNASLAPLAADETASWEFPSGSYEFMGLNDAALGACHICPLISPLGEYASQQEALAVATEIASALFERNGGSEGRRGMSRRDFLRFNFSGG